MTQDSPLGAVILCGGQSRRMGQPKAWLPFGPERLLQRVVRLVGLVADEVVVVAASEQDLPSLPGSVRVLHDLIADQGPLRGLATGLKALPDTVGFVFASATDVPFLQPAWIERLVDLAGDHDLVIPRVEGRLHPLAGLYRREPTLLAAEALLAVGQLRVTGLLDRLRSRIVEASELELADPGLATVLNLNTPAEYWQAITDAGLVDATGRVTASRVDSSRLFPPSQAR